LILILPPNQPIPIAGEFAIQRSSWIVPFVPKFVYTVAIHGDFRSPQDLVKGCGNGTGIPWSQCSPANDIVGSHKYCSTFVEPFQQLPSPFRIQIFVLSYSFEPTGYLRNSDPDIPFLGRLRCGPNLRLAITICDEQEITILAYQIVCRESLPLTFQPDVR
jgi:hypothetical protein